MDSPSCRLYRSLAGLWVPYPCHRYIQWPLDDHPHVLFSPPPSYSPLFDQPCQTSINPSIVASGLYYLSELVEEHTVFARKLLTRLIYAIIATQTLLALIDRFPLLLSLVSIISHGVYLGNLRHFPIVKLTDLVFIFSCGKLLSLCHGPGTSG